MTLYPIILCIGLILNVVAFVYLYKVIQERKKYELATNENEIQEEEVVVEPVEEVPPPPKKVKTNREIIDANKALEEAKKQGDSEDELKVFDIRLFEPSKYENGDIPFDEDEETNNEENIEKRLQYHAKKIDKSIRK